MKNKVNTIRDFANNLSYLDKEKLFQGIHKPTDYEMSRNELQFCNSLAVKYKVGYVSVLKDLKDILVEHIDIGYDSQALINKLGKASAQIRVYPEYYDDFEINLIGNGLERKISIRLESSDARQLQKIQTNYEFTLKELSKRKLLDTLLKIMNEYLIRKEDWN